MRSSIPVGLLLTVALLGAGCSAQDVVKDQVDSLTKKAAQTAAESAIKAKTGQDVKVDFDQKGASFTDPKTGRAFAIGEKVAIPSIFPKDVPIYSPATPTSVDVNSGGVDAGLLLVSADARKKVQDWYASEAVKDGWTVDGTHEMADNAILSFSRSENGGTAKLTITLSSDGQGKTNIILARRGVK